MFSIQENNSKKILTALGFLFSFVLSLTAGTSVREREHKRLMREQLILEMGLVPGVQPASATALQPDLSPQIQDLESQVWRLRTENLTLRTDLVKAKNDLAKASGGRGSNLLGAVASAAAGAVVGAGATYVVSGGAGSEGGGVGAGDQQAIIHGLQEQLAALHTENLRLGQANGELQGQINVLRAQVGNLGATGDLSSTARQSAAELGGADAAERIQELEAQVQALVDLIPEVDRIIRDDGEVDLAATIRKLCDSLNAAEAGVTLQENLIADLEKQIEAVCGALRRCQEALPENLRLNNIDENFLGVLQLTLARFINIWAQVMAAEVRNNLRRNRRNSDVSSCSDISEL